MEACLGFQQTSNMECFLVKANSEKQFTIVVKRFIINVCRSPGYTPGYIEIQTICQALVQLNIKLYAANFFRKKSIWNIRNKSTLLKW